MRYLWFVCAILMVLPACNQTGTDLYINPTFVDPAAGIVKIAVLPFGSTLHPSDDPDGLAPMTMEKFFEPQLDARSDYTFIAPSTVRYAIEREGWSDKYNKFLNTFAGTGKVDKKFLGPLAETLRADAFLIPVVDVWQKDEVDIEENSTPATYVGATITIIDAKKKLGQVLFRATREDYLEGARSETSDRSIVRSGGRVRSDAGSKLFRAPPFEDVAVKVAESLVASLPQR